MRNQLCDTSGSSVAYEYWEVTEDLSFFHLSSWAKMALNYSLVPYTCEAFYAKAPRDALLRRVTTSNMTFGTIACVSRMFCRMCAGAFVLGDHELWDRSRLMTSL